MPNKEKEWAKQKAERDEKAVESMKKGFGLKSGLMGGIKKQPTTNEERQAAVEVYDNADRGGARDTIIKELTKADKLFTVQYLQKKGDRNAISANAFAAPHEFPFNAGEVPTNGGGKKKRRKPKKKSNKLHCRDRTPGSFWRSTIVVLCAFQQLKMFVRNCKCSLQLCGLCML